MRIDHRGLHIRMAEQLLDRSDVIPVLEQMRGKGMPECVTSHRLGDLRLSARDPHRFLHGRLLEMMTAPYPAARIDAEVCRGKYVLPRPLARRIRVFARQGI